MSGLYTNLFLREVLSEGAVQVLRARGENPELQNGVRVISNSSYMSGESISSSSIVSIPDHIESLETLKFLEFNDDAAQIIWQQFLEVTRREPDRADLLYSARAYVRGVAGDALYSTDDWIGVTQRIGLTRQFQERIMDEEYTEMRLTGSCKEWVLEMIAMRFEFLLTFDATVKTSSKGVQRMVSHLDVSNNLRSGPRIADRGTSLPQTGESSVSERAPPISTVTQKPPSSMSGHKMLFIGGAIANLERVHKDNKLDFVKLTSTPPGDFSDITRGLYFAKDATAAWQYASWAKNLVDRNVVPVGLMTIAVPDHIFSSTKELYGEEWRRFVWGCRTLSVPEDLEHLADYQWLVGGLCRQSQNLVNKMSNISELQVWKMRGNETASQYFTGHRSMFKILNTECVGKVWITALA